MVRTLALSSLFSTALAGTVLWDGRFNGISGSAQLATWSWSNEVGPYQWYIHGAGPISEYVNLDPSYKNPADTVSTQGVKMSIDSTSYWNGQQMRRTELIPQTTAPINQGLVYYHFSMMRSNTNPPSSLTEHQVNFFESHFTEMKYGLISGAQGTSDPTLRWDVGGVSKWTTTYDAGVWHNVAYGIDFTANTVSFYHSTGADPLVLTAGPFSASCSSNGADWHLGVLRLQGSLSLSNPDTEDWYFSGVYVESGSLTTAIGSGSGTPPPPPPPPPVSTSAAPTTLATSTKVVSTSTPVPVSSTSSAKPVSTTSVKVSSSTSVAVTGGAPKYSQCGGIGWKGATTCAAGSTCTVSNPYYSQCL
ncbi:hypothetical protein MMC25_000422 [Agyrium rufum]|nr:hypothetical protein [Agyrium rufum]